MTKKKR